MVSDRLNQLGWKPEVDLEKGLFLAYQDLKTHLGALNQ
jgi:nucleoside-diphosphate-sugar epimerase